MNLETENSYLELPTPAGETIKVLRKSHPRARRLRLTVTSGGARVTYPEGTHPAQVFAFLRKHGEWLERKLGELHLGAQPPALEPGVTTVIPLRGETTRLVWRAGTYPRIEQNADRLVLTLPSPHKRALDAARGLLRSYLEAQMRKDVSRLLARYCPSLGAAPNALRVRPLKSLWGSLDTRDRVTLDLALALAPPAVLKYVVVHELCHLRIRNHSRRFWNLVESLQPNWMDQRDWLRLNGQALKAELSRLVHAPGA
ncbi:MAG TPA: SprT family zinc-dependent metalloprotease [Dokdonella sp.]|jgi:predicted metal-dependent hydrolase|nr:SprT family zinc-dependent metalloprotease [Dokdonella sp.]